MHIDVYRDNIYAKISSFAIKRLTISLAYAFYLHLPFSIRYTFSLMFSFFGSFTFTVYMIRFDDDDDDVCVCVRVNRPQSIQYMCLKVYIVCIFHLISILLTKGYPNTALL